MARLGRTQLKSVVPLVRAPQSVAYLQGSISSFEITTTGSVSFPVPVYFAGSPTFQVSTQGQIVKAQDLTDTVNIRIGATTGQAQPVGLLLAITDPTRGLTYQLDRSLTVSASASGVFAKNLSKNVTRSVTTTPTVNKGLFRTLILGGTATASFIKGVVKLPFSVGTTATATILRLSVVERFIIATSTVTSSISRRINKPLSVTTGTGTTFTKVLTKTLLTPVSQASTFVKNLSKTLSVSNSVFASVNRSGMQEVILAVSTNVTTSIQKTVSKTVAKTVSILKSLTTYAPNASTGAEDIVQIKTTTSEVIVISHAGSDLDLLINTNDHLLTRK